MTALTRTIHLPTNAVFRALTQPVSLREWLCDMALIAPRKGGALYCWWSRGYYAAGILTEYEPDKMIAFTWKGLDDPAATDVKISLQAQGDDTVVTLAHNASDANAFESVWSAALDNLRSVLETGDDLRLSQRPVFGLGSSNPLTPELAAKLGVPVQQGIQINALMADLPAAQAGLQVNDVIVSIDSKKVTSYQDFAGAMVGYKPGDSAEIAFWRGAEQQTIRVTFAAPQPPADPGRPQEAAAKLRENHRVLDAELEALFSGVGEADAEYAPTATEWSAKKVLAHLIWTERYMQFALWGALGGDDRVPWPDNNDASLVGILAVYPTIPELLEEMRRAERATATTIAAFPTDTPGRIMTYRRFANAFIALEGHNRAHHRQIEEALKTAKLYRESLENAAKPVELV